MNEKEVFEGKVTPMGFGDENFLVWGAGDHVCAILHRSEWPGVEIRRDGSTHLKYRVELREGSPYAIPAD